MKRTLILVLIIVGCLGWAAMLEAKTFYVDTFDDSVAIDGHCSLREALNAANGATIVDDACGFGDPGKDVINLEPGIYYLITPNPFGDESCGAELCGDLDVKSEVVFNAYLGNVTIKQEQDSEGDVWGRVLEIRANGIATLKNITIEGGEETLGGGGILNWGWLLLENVTVTGNTSELGGGGIETQPGSITHIYDSTISANTSTRADGLGGGGGIRVTGGQVYLNGSTISGNESHWHGGGITAKSGGLVDLLNSTVSGNGSFVHGGGIYNDGGNIGLSNVTVTDNTSNSDLSADNDGYGGGVVNNGAGVVNLWNSLIAGNVRGVGGGFALLVPDCAGTLTSQGYNLVGYKSSTCNIVDAGPGGDQIGDPAMINALLGPLADNNGPTLTHSLMAGSPAIDTGNPLGCRAAGGGLVTKDQRGSHRPSGSTCDVGAYEFGYNATRYIVDSNTDDGSGCTLREALESIMSGTPADGCSNAGTTGVDTIEFAAMVQGTIALTSNLPTVNQSIHIVGPGSSLLAIDGQGSYRSGLHVDSPGNVATVVIEGLTFTRGYAGDEGGALLVYDGEVVELVDIVVKDTNCLGGAVVVAGHVVMTQSTIRDGFGTGLRVSGGSVQMTDSIVSGNTSALSAGGVKVQNSSLTIIGSTFSGNSASEGGGAMAIVNMSSEPVDIERSTFSGNSAGWGGAISIGGGMASISNSVINDNRAVATNGGGGGGIAVSGSGTLLTIANTTISGNSAFGSGGGLKQDTPGGEVRLANVTITDNTTDDTASGNYHGGGIAIVSGSNLHLKNSIIAGNHSLNPTDNVPEVAGCAQITSEDYNLLGDVSLFCTPSTWAAHDITGADPQLGPLGSYGGPTRTHNLLIGSAAIDGANPAGCSWDHDSSPGTPDIMLTTDQRVWARYVDGNGDDQILCDAGAFEYDGTTFSDIIFNDGFE